MLRCTHCLKEATHAVYFAKREQHWYAQVLYKATVRRPHAAPRYCRWHATCEAVCRNHAKEEHVHADTHAAVARPVRR